MIINCNSLNLIYFINRNNSKLPSLMSNNYSILEGNNQNINFSNFLIK